MDLLVVLLVELLEVAGRLPFRWEKKPEWVDVRRAEMIQFVC